MDNLFALIRAWPPLYQALCVVTCLLTIGVLLLVRRVKAKWIA